jgi:hypothetical protein
MSQEQAKSADPEKGEHTPVRVCLPSFIPMRRRAFAMSSNELPPASESGPAERANAGRQHLTVGFALLDGLSDPCPRIPGD